MLYRFANFFYKTTPSPCAPTGNGVDLSQGDERGLALLYPASEAAIGAMADKANHGLDLLAGAEEIPGGGLEGTRPSSSHADRLVELMTARAAMTN